MEPKFWKRYSILRNAFHCSKIPLNFLLHSLRKSTILPFFFQILSFQLLPSFFLSFFSNSFSSISHRGKTKPSVIVKNEPLYSESWEWGYTCNIKNVWCILTINSFWDRSVHLKIFGKSYFQKATPRFTIFSYRWSLPPSLHSFIRLFIMYLFIW